MSRKMQTAEQIGAEIAGNWFHLPTNGLSPAAQELASIASAAIRQRDAQHGYRESRFKTVSKPVCPTCSAIERMAANDAVLTLNLREKWMAAQSKVGISPNIVTDKDSLAAAVAALDAKLAKEKP